MTDQPIDLIFGSKQTIKERLYGCWIPFHWGMQDLFLELGLAQLDPRLVFVHASADPSREATAEIKSFRDDDPTPEDGDLKDITSDVARWRDAPPDRRSGVLGELVERVFLSFDTVNEDLTPRCGTPVLVDGQLVVPVLLVRRSGLVSTLNSLERVGQSQAGVNRSPGFNLLSLVLQHLLWDISAALRDREFGTVGRVFSNRDSSDLLRRAGRALGDVATRGMGADLGQLYDVCSAISALPYEQKACYGTILLATDGDVRVADRVLFRNPVRFVREQARAVRKLLESTSPSMALLCDAKAVFGLGREQVVERTNRLRSMVFAGRGTWSLRLGDDVAMHVRDGVAGLPWAPINESSLRSALRTLDPSVTDEVLARALDLAGAAARADHGVLVVFSKDPIRAVQQLGPQCMAVEPFGLTPERLDELSQVDGALVLSVDGRCHAFGAILDGRAAPDREDRSRGARYNSAVRYVIQSAGDAVALIVSSDRMADVIQGAAP